MTDSNSQPTGNTSASVGSDENSTQIQPIRMPTIADIQDQDFRNNCAVRAVTSGFMGGVGGLMIGLFVGALDNPIMHDTMTARQQFVFTAKQMGQRSWNSCKTLAVMGLLLSATECIVEKARAKHDSTNNAIAGCVTGGLMSARGGPQAACIGCAGFATFSVLLEKFIDRHT